MIHLLQILKILNIGKASNNIKVKQYCNKLIRYNRYMESYVLAQDNLSFGKMITHKFKVKHINFQSLLAKMQSGMIKV